MNQIVIEAEQAVTPNVGGQLDFCNDWVHPIVGLEGGWYSGKTWAGARKLVSLHIFNAFNEDGTPSYVISFVVAPTYGNASDFDIPELNKALDEAGLEHDFKSSGTFADGKYAAPGIIIPELGTKENPSVILIRSADVPKRITGFTAGAAWGDEPARWKKDDLDPLNDPYIQMLGRVRGIAKVKQIMFTYTNEGDVTKIYEEFHDGNPKKKLYRAPTKSNPHATEFEEMQRDVLTEELVEQYLEGGAISLLGGKLYRRFDMDLHVNSGLKIRNDLPLQLSVDFNIVPGMHMELGQYHGDRDLFTELYEIYGPRLAVDTATARVVALLKSIDYKWDEKKPLEVYGDATGQSEWTGTGVSNYFIIQQALKDQGIPYRVRVPKSNPLVQDRINAVNCALSDSKGDIHYLVHPRCKRLIEDLKKMQYDKYGEVDKTDKKLSHPSDAVGYRIWYIRPVRIKIDRTGGRFGV